MVNPRVCSVVTFVPLLSPISYLCCISIENKFAYMKVKFQVYGTNFVGEIGGKKNSWTCYFIGLI